uniref:Uncharacterized protein n=1 Tax=Romanomermis culicivorax TaxID=13658 RepID=A0A915I6T8_ROMCU
MIDSGLCLAKDIEHLFSIFDLICQYIAKTFMFTKAQNSKGSQNNFVKIIEINLDFHQKRQRNNMLMYKSYKHKLSRHFLTAQQKIRITTIVKKVDMAHPKWLPMGLENP